MKLQGNVSVLGFSIGLAQDSSCIVIYILVFVICHLEINENHYITWYQSFWLNPTSDYNSQSPSTQTYPCSALVLICIYSIPHWLCMERIYIMMSLLIQDPKQPGNDIDIYVAPLIEDMKKLRSLDFEMYDAYMGVLKRYVNNRYRLEGH